MTTFTTEDLEELKTAWFTSKQKPKREGSYEVVCSTWPWPSMCEWTKEHGWYVDAGVKVTKWRGLKANPELDK